MTVSVACSMTSSLPPIVFIKACCSLASPIVVCQVCCPCWACYLLCQACCPLGRGCRDIGESLLYGGKSSRSVKLNVHDRVHCWVRDLLSMWWKPKEVGKAWCHGVRLLCSRAQGHVRQTGQRGCQGTQWGLGVARTNCHDGTEQAGTCLQRTTIGRRLRKVDYDRLPMYPPALHSLLR